MEISFEKIFFIFVLLFLPGLTSTPLLISKALDISSGVEVRPGKKSKTKMKNIFSKLISTKNKGYNFD